MQSEDHAYERQHTCNQNSSAQSLKLSLFCGAPFENVGLCPGHENEKPQHSDLRSSPDL